MRLSSLLFILGGYLFTISCGGCPSSSKPPSSAPSSNANSNPGTPITGSKYDQKTEAFVKEFTKAETILNVPEESLWFSDVTSKTNIDFVHFSGDSSEKPFPAANGSGIAAIDYDLDGLQDLYFGNGAAFPIDLTKREHVNHLYRNRGDWKFQDVTQHCGLGCSGYSAGLAVGDYDSDGFPDVYISRFGENLLFRNLGDGTFENVEKNARVDDKRWGTSSAFLDYNHDGLLDIYVGNYAEWDFEHNPFCGNKEKNLRMYCNPRAVNPVSDVLYKNLGDGTFADASEESGISKLLCRTQGVLAVDLNQDGLIDLYLANDLNPNSMFLNNGNGTFRDVTELSGAAYNHQGAAQAGMGVDATDYDRNGLIDLFVTNFAGDHNTLYEQGVLDIFQDVTYRKGLATESMPWVGWGTYFADFDLDGWFDIVVNNGHVDDNRNLFGQDTYYRQPPLLFQNMQGKTYQYVAAKAGKPFTQARVGRGLSCVDLDNDGDQDLVLSHQNTPPLILANNRIRPSRREKCSITLKLIGVESNRDAVGSTITLHQSGEKIIQQIKGGGSYLSARDQRIVFAVDPQSASLDLEIRWPNQKTISLKTLLPGGNYVIIEGNHSPP